MSNPGQALLDNLTQLSDDLDVADYLQERYEEFLETAPQQVADGLLEQLNEEVTAALGYAASSNPVVGTFARVASVARGR